MADIFRTIKNRNYTVMSNHHLQNPRLSLKAMGLMSKVLSLPEDWNYSVKGLAAYCKDGYESIRTALCELEEEGYLIRRQLRDDKGRIAGTEYIFREIPEMEVPETEGRASETEEKSEKKEQKEEKGNARKPENIRVSPESENPILVHSEDEDAESEAPQSDFPSADNPSSENRHQQNTNKQNTNINNILSSSSGIKNIIKREEEEEEAVKKVKKQIGYDFLRKKYGTVPLDEVVELMAEVSLPGHSAPFYTVSQTAVSREKVQKRFSALKQDHIREILEAIGSGPPIRNMRAYLLTALYQSEAAVHINAMRKRPEPSKKDKNQFNNFHQRSYNLKDLEEQLLNAQKGS